MEDDREQWTGVKKRRKKKTKCVQEAVSDRDSAITVAGARPVYYDERGGIPGLYVRRGCTLDSVSWTLIKTTPISPRTQSRFK